jgi:hypothetical protein
MKGRALVLLLAAAPALACAAWDRLADPDFFDDAVARTARHFWSAQELYGGGKGDTALIAFAVGVHDADASNRSLRRPYCVPDGVTARQLGDVAWKYLDEHPADRHLPAALLVRESFRAAWPCAAK